MRTFESNAEMHREMARFAFAPTGTFTEEEKDQLEKLATEGPSFMQIMNMIEFLYAKRERLDVAGMEFAAALTAFATANGWGGLADADQRGAAIVGAMRRDSGARAAPGYPHPKRENDPPAKPQFVADAAPGPIPVAPPAPAAPPPPAAPAAKSKT